MSRIWPLFISSVGSGLFLISFGSAAGNTPESSARSSDRELISQCRRHSDDQLTPASIREALRALCASLRSQYVRKHGLEP
jgi:hypothetical protein